MSDWISLTPSGKQVIDSIGDYFKERKNIADSSSDALVQAYRNAKDDPNTSPNREFKEWYIDKMSELKDNSDFQVTLPSEAASEAIDKAKEKIRRIGPSSGSGGGSGYGGPSADAVLQSQTMQDYINMIQKTTDANNAWAADQAQKQMDFQERMARNAHQYEIEDLQKAGLNPVLSASGGNGASMASGAMAQPDTNNSNLVAQLAMQAVDSLGSSAIQVANGYSSKASNNFKNSLLGIASKYFVPALARGAAAAITRGLF